MKKRVARATCNRQMGCYRQRGGDNGIVLMTAVTQEQEQISKLLREERDY